MAKKKYVRRISDDTSRCHDVACSLRKKCLRYLNRHTGGEHTVHTNSLSNYMEHLKGCEFFIENK